jgi:hypothetical protein
MDSSALMMETMKILQQTIAENQRLSAEIQELRDRAIRDESGRNFAEKVEEDGFEAKLPDTAKQFIWTEGERSDVEKVFGYTTQY